jgi:ABC-type glycerol-3-phosphate transport system substrate-binding protein
MRTAYTFAASLLAIGLLAGCATSVAGTAAPELTRGRAVDEAQLQSYLDRVAQLYRDELGPSFPFDATTRHNAEVTGRKMCAAMAAGVQPEDAYAAAFPAVAAAGNVGDLEAREGQLADTILCPAR